MSLLELKNVQAGYGKLPVVRGVDLEVGEGSIASLIGPNGAGKSTVLKTVFGLTGWVRGGIAFAGRDLRGLPSHEIIGKGICFVHQGRNVFPSMTVAENLEMGAFARDDVDLAAELERVYALFPVLAEKRGEEARRLSGGQQQMLGMGRALVSKPRMLLLDEPSLGLAPKTMDELFGKILEIRKSGVTLLIVEQNVHEALRVSDRTHILVEGKIEFSGTPKEVLESDRLRKAYLGARE